MVIGQRRSPHRRVVAHVALKCGVDEMRRAFALGVSAVVALTAGAEHLCVVHSECRAKSSRRTVGMARTAARGGSRVHGGQGVATGACTCAGHGGWNLSVIDGNRRFPQSGRRVMAHIAIIRCRNVTSRLGMARRTSANDFKVINPNCRGKSARRMAGFAAIGGVGVAGGAGVTTGARAASNYLQVIHSEHRPERQCRMAGLAHVGRVDVSGVLADGRSAIVAARATSHHLGMVNGLHNPVGVGRVASLANV